PPPLPRPPRSPLFPYTTLFRSLNRARTCYVCKRPFRELDPWYPQLCLACAHTSRAHKERPLDLHGRRALITGARVNIGYATALRSEEHTSELQSRGHLVCRLLL